MEPKNSNPLKSLFSVITFIIILAISWLIYLFVFGDPSHFKDGNSNNDPIDGDYFGIVYKGGFVVPFLMTLVLSVIVFSIERAVTLTIAGGKGSADRFLYKIRTLLQGNNIDEAMQECDVQKGSLGNVVKAGLKKYKQMQGDMEMTKDQKVLAIQKDIEEATELELPALEKHLVIIATIASIATLLGLFGTVLGMVRAFAALGTSGSASAQALATGISEALINTALGIFASGLAIIMYNMFTSTIDKITYSIDEAGFSIIQTFSSTQK